jgi:hypothetical protein
VGAVLCLAPSFSAGRTLHGGSPTLAVEEVAGLLGMLCFAVFMSIVYVIMFLYAPVFGFVLGVGYVELRLYYCVVLLLRWVVVSMFCVLFIIVVGVCYGCVVVRSGVPIVIGGRVLVYLSVCRAVFTS